MQVVWSSLSEGRGVGDAIFVGVRFWLLRCENCSLIVLDKNNIERKDDRELAQIPTVSVNTAVDLHQMRPLLCRTKREAKTTPPSARNRSVVDDKYIYPR